MTGQEQDRSLSSSVVRAFELLDQVAAAGPDGITLARLSADTPKARSTTHRYVTTLLHLGILRRSDGGRLHLGLKLLGLAVGLLEGDSLRSVAEPVLRDLGARTGETVHLGVPVDGQVVYIAKVESPQSVRLVSRIGAHVDMHCSSMGKAIMAQLPPAELQEALALPRPIRTLYTITGREELIAELETIRATGVAIDREENELGVCCMGAAVIDSRSAPVAAISVSGPASRMTHDRCEQISPLLFAAARRIGQSLGFGDGHYQLA